MTGAAHQAPPDYDGEPRVLVNVLGYFDVWHGERDLTPSAGHRAAVVQLLALHDGVMHRDRLVAELWPDDPPGVGQQRLRNVLYHLRRHTGPFVGRGPRRYNLVRYNLVRYNLVRYNLVRYTQPVRIDLTEFLHLSANAVSLARTDPDAAIEHGTRTLMLYRGPLLLDQPDADWAHPPRIHATERRALLLGVPAEASERLEELDQALLYRLD